MEDFRHVKGKKERLNRIINAAFKVFSLNDFEKASTSLIVKEAKISRGLLYHYFKDKNELYEYLLYYSYSVIADNMKQRVEWDNNDYYERFYHSMQLKVELIEKYPYVFDFFDKYSHNIDPTRFESHRGNMFPHKQDKIHFSNIDESLFKDGIDIRKVTKTTEITIIGIINRAIKKTNLWSEKLDTEQLLEEIKEYIEFFKTQFYK